METILARRSVRAYDGQPLSPADREAVLAAIAANADRVPFGTKPRFALVDDAGVPDAGPRRIGTYGLMKGARAFVVGCVRPGPLAYVDYGYALEGMVLEATAAGLGTCWIGGVFDRGASGRALRLERGEVVPAVTPVGRPADRPALAGEVIRAMAGSTGRKPWPELFFDAGWERPLAEADAGSWAPVLEAVRRGPSASNRQPWRVVMAAEPGGTAFHLYLREDRAYSRAIPGVRLQDMDMGIAMRNFEEAARCRGLPGGWARLDKDPVPGPAPLAYVASWTT